jgi:hypothetical protein
VMYNPLARDTFGTSPAKRRARVGDRLGAQVRKYVEDPLSLTAVNGGGGGDFAFLRAGLLLRADSMPRAARVKMVPAGAVIRRRAGLVYSRLPGLGSGSH